MSIFSPYTSSYTPLNVENMAKRGLGMIFLIRLSAIVVVVLLVLSLSTLSYTVAEEISKEKKGALTVLETSNEDEVNDGIVSDEPNEEENGPGNEQPDSEELFVPTKEWKTVKKGQKIPQGLHVRMNLQTGEKEAKLMDEEPEEPLKNDVNQWDAGGNIGVINTEKQRFTRDELKKVVKDFKLKDMDSKQPEDKEDVKKKYRSYDELKKAMKDMELSVKTEAEIVTELVRDLKQQETNTENLKTVLIDLEYYLHQIDNARLFCDLGGMKILLKLMNDTNEDIRAKAAHALGAAVQSNGKVQVEAVEHGVLQHLLKIVAVDPSSAVKKKSLFALSALLRHFPFAQKKFVMSGGLTALSELFFGLENQPFKVKIITLLTDLVQEHELNAKHQASGDEIHQEKSRQYKEVEMRKAMQAQGWCAHLTKLLEELTDHDDVEKTLSAMSIMQSDCKKEFAFSRPKLKALSSYYNTLAKEDGDDPDSYFISIQVAVETLLKEIPFAREDL